MQDLLEKMKMKLIKLFLFIVAVYISLCIIFYGNPYLSILVAINDYAFFILGRFFDVEK